MDSIIYEGSIIPFNISLTKFGPISMAQYDFTIYASCSPQKIVEIPKSEALCVNDDNYMFWLDTSKTGSGNLRFAVVASVPDTDYPDKVRPEIEEFDSGYKVVKSKITGR